MDISDLSSVNYDIVHICVPPILSARTSRRNEPILSPSHGHIILMDSIDVQLHTVNQTLIMGFSMLREWKSPC